MDLFANGLIKAQLRSLAKSWAGDRRLPITPPILFRLLLKVDAIFVKVYFRFLFKAILLLGFLACMRLSEIAAPTKCFDHTLRKNDVVLKDGGIEVHFTSFKHARRPLTLSFANSELVNQVKVALSNYIKLRPTQTDFFFSMETGAPVPRAFVTKYLRATLQVAGFPADDFSSHSLRLGGATHAMLQGASALQVQKLGRWSSSAFLNYLRPFVLQLSNLDLK